MNNLPVAKEALPFLVLCGLMSWLLSYLDVRLSLFPLFFAVFALYFFRNPSRKILLNEDLVYSPADGVVQRVEKIRENRFLHQEVWKVTIFLSIFNVHFNRSPAAGRVEHICYTPGKFIPAFKSHASEINERNYLVLDTGRARIMVCQITGFIARRIVCWSKKGDRLAQGERFGLIKFGSCTECYLPLDYQVTVERGSKVKGGVSVIGRCA